MVLSLLNLYTVATDRSFTPTTDPTFSQTKWGPVTDTNGNPLPSFSGSADQELTGTLTFKHETNSSLTIGGSVEQSFGVDIGVVDAELSVKFSAGHTWESSTTDSQSITVTAGAGETVYIQASAGTGTFTGNFAFTIGGERYLINNVTITQPAAPDVDGGAVTNYRVMQISSKAAGVPHDTKGGFLPPSKTPGLQKLIGPAN